MNDTGVMVNCLRNVDAGELVASGDKFKTFDIEPLIIFGPVVEKKTKQNPRPYLTKDPVQLILDQEFKHIPWMVGVMQEEGDLRTSALLRPNETRQELNAKFDTLLPSVLGLELSVPTSEVNAAWKSMKDFYLHGSNYVDINNRTQVKGFIDMYSDRAFIYGIYQGVLLHSLKGHWPIYFYKFEYRGAYSYGDFFATTKENIDYNWGASHCDDLLYLFRSPALFPDLQPNSSDLTVSRIMVQMWTDFAKYGNPTPRADQLMWIPVYNGTREKIYGNNVEFLNISGTYTIDEDEHISLKTNCASCLIGWNLWIAYLSQEDRKSVV